MVSPAAQQDPTRGRKEYAPVRYELASDPVHTKLRAVNDSDICRIVVVIDKMKHAGKDYAERVELLALWKRALHWKWSNRVSDPAESDCAADADGTPGKGYAVTFATFGECLICVPPTPDYPKEEWYSHVQFNDFRNLGQHCEAHADAYHEWVPDKLVCPCVPPYDPAHAYAWRAHDPWQHRED
jgi:hypothetical protein